MYDVPGSILFILKTDRPAVPPPASSLSLPAVRIHFLYLISVFHPIGVFRRSEGASFPRSGLSGQTGRAARPGRLRERVRASLRGRRSGGRPEISRTGRPPERGRGRTVSIFRDRFNSGRVRTRPEEGGPLYVPDSITLPFRVKRFARTRLNPDRIRMHSFISAPEETGIRSPRPRTGKRQPPADAGVLLRDSRPPHGPACGRLSCFSNPVRRLQS